MDDHQRNDIQKLMARLNRQMRPAREAMAQIAKIKLPDETVRAITKLQDWVKVNGPKMAEIAAVAQMHYRRSMADNLRDLTTDEWFAATKMMSEPDGQVIVWTPPPEVVRRLLGASTASEREDELVASASEVSPHARQVLEAVTSPRLQHLRMACGEGWDAWDARLPRAAQALAAACLTSVIQDLLPFDGFSHLRKTWEKHEEAGAGVEQRAIIQLRYGLLMKRTWVAVLREDQALPGFNRHASAHHVDPVQYTPAHCVQSLMLVTAWARELQFLDASEHLVPIPTRDPEGLD